MQMLSSQRPACTECPHRCIINLEAHDTEAKQGTRSGHLANTESRRATISFMREIRWALQHLYEAGELGSSPLMIHFGLAQQNSAASTLRHILTEAIEALKPGIDVPPDSKDWRIYHILYHRYIEQFTQRQVAASVALSIRQLRREETFGIRLLAKYLCTHYGIRPDTIEIETEVELTDSDTLPVMPLPTASLQEQELVWVRNSFPREPTDVNDVLTSALSTVEPLILSSGVHVHLTTREGLPHAGVQPDSLRQALLNVLTVAVRIAPQGWLDIETTMQENRIFLTIQPKRSCLLAASPARDELESLEMARDLVTLSGGLLEIAAANAEHPFTARFLLPSEEGQNILFIDDNADTLRLLERYLAGTRYRFVGARDAEQAMELATSLSLKAIVLDIMLPGIDGWRVLGRLREHPKTRGVPIIVCSILQQEPLAMALGAAAFLHKPVSREALLSMLNAQTTPETPKAP